MTTVVHLKASEFNNEVFKRLQAILSHESNAEVTITVESKSLFGKKETRQEYMKRLTSAMDNADNGKNLLSFTAKEFSALTSKMLKND